MLLPAFVIECLLIFSLAFTLFYTVRHRSGLQEPDKIHRIWSRIDEIRLQPIPQTLAFSSAISYGAYSVITIIMAFVPVIFNYHFSKHTIAAAVFGLAIMTLACGLAVITYLVGGGSNWKTAVWGSFGLHIIMYYAYVFIGNAVKQVLEDAARRGMKANESSVVSMIYFVIPLFSLGMQFLLSCWVRFLNLPPTARKIYNPSIVPNWVKLDRSIMIAAVPLVAVHLIGLTIQSMVGSASYFARVVFYLTSVMLLAVSGLVSIISVNRALLANEFEWQWRAFLTPAIPLAAMDLIIMLIFTILGKGSGFFLGLLECARLFFGYGSSGALAAYVYLLVAERYARQYVDEDVAAQTDLLGEFADDDDNEELEV